MNIKPLIRTAIFVLLSVACSFLVLLLGTAIIMRSDDPAALAPIVGYAALFCGATVCGILCGTQNDCSLFVCGLCGGVAFGVIVTLISVFFSGTVGLGAHLLLTMGCVIVTTGVSCIRAIPTKKGAKSKIRKKYLRARR